MTALAQSSYYKTLPDSPAPIHVLQGQTVHAQAHGESQQADLADRLAISHDEPLRGCRDCIWSILFYAHLGVIMYCTIAYTPQFIQDVAQTENSGGRRLRLFRNRFLQNAEGDDGMGADIYVDTSVILCIIGVAFATSLIISSLTLGFMMVFAEALVKLSLFFNIGFMLLLGVLFLAAGSVGSGVSFLLFAVVAAYYTCRVWARIPFAASNLKTASSAVRANLGLSFYAYLSIVAIFAWSVWWTICFFSTMYVTNGCNGDGECQSEGNAGIVFLFFLSYYWTVQVLANVVHCTTAGVVGTWWYIPNEANGCCSKAVRDSYVRSITSSFGSICFASLIVAIIQAVRELIHGLRENGDSFIACCAECLLACIESLVELFNRFALVYVAVHGQSFLQAGRSVMDLFRARGWTTIITDMLVDTVLFMMSLGVGLLIGLLALLVGMTFGLQGTGFLGSTFFLGFIVGYACCATLLSVVSSAVNTVIVLYAESPNEFEVNHPELSHQMRTSWRQAWPHEFSY
jgi:hypothetical protein